MRSAVGFWREAEWSLLTQVDMPPSACLEAAELAKANKQAVLERTEKQISPCVNCMC